MKKALLALSMLALFGLGSPAKASILFAFSSVATTPPGGVDPQPTTTITYSGNSGGADADGLGSDIKVSFISLTSPSGAGAVSSPFTFDITITDLATSASDIFTLSGTLTGAVATDSSNLTFTFSGSTTKKVGNSLYTVSAKFVDVPTVETGGITKDGSITAHVTATVVPEPTTVAMAALGLPFALMVIRRKTRKV